MAAQLRSLDREPLPCDNSRNTAWCWQDRGRMVSRLPSHTALRMLPRHSHSFRGFGWTLPVPFVTSTAVGEETFVDSTLLYLSTASYTSFLQINFVCRVFCLHLCRSTTFMQGPRKNGKAIIYPRTEVTDGWEPP